MTTTVDSSKDRDLAQIAMLVEATDELRAAAERIMRMRDEAIRHADEAGHVPRTRLAKIAGVDRSRLYLILNAREADDEDGQAALRDSVESLYWEAHRRWDEAGQWGDIGDYFPIEDTLHDAS